MYNLSGEECFKILGLDCGKQYTADFIKKAFHKLALKYHPDRNPGDQNAEEIFKKINYAYEFITNPQFRFQKTQNKSKDLDVVINIPLSFEDGFFGKELNLNFNTDSPAYKDKNIIFNIEPFTIKILPGSHGMQEHVFQSKGLRKSDIYGDLVIRLMFAQHVNFKIQDSNVISFVSCPLAKLIKGGILAIQTCWGICDIIVPQGSRPGDCVRIPLKGVDKRGYHIVTLEMMFPNHDDLKSDDWKGFIGS